MRRANPLFFREVIPPRTGKVRRYIKRCLRRPKCAISFVQAASNTNASGTAISVTITTTGGHFLVVAGMQHNNATGTLAITDSSGLNVWQQTASGYASHSSSNRMAMFWSSTSSGVTSVTFTWTGTAAALIEGVVLEFSGMAGVGSLAEDSSVNSSNAATVTTLASGALTTSNPNDVLVYVTEASGAASPETYVPGLNYILPANAASSFMAMQYLVVSGAQVGTITSMSWNQGSGTAGIFAGFKGDPGVVGTVITPDDSQPMLQIQLPNSVVSTWG